MSLTISKAFLLSIPPCLFFLPAFPASLEPSVWGIERENSITNTDSSLRLEQEPNEINKRTGWEGRGEERLGNNPLPQVWCTSWNIISRGMIVSGPNLVAARRSKAATFFLTTSSKNMAASLECSRERNSKEIEKSTVQVRG